MNKYIIVLYDGTIEVDAESIADIVNNNLDIDWMNVIAIFQNN